MPKAPKSKTTQTWKVIHPNSRKASQMARQNHHDHKVERRKDERVKKLEALADKLRFFHSCLEEKTEFTKEEVLEILDSYFHRFDGELEQIELVNSIGGRNGQRHVAREQVIHLTQEKERQEFNTVGIEVPDILNKKNLKSFREWTGEAKFLPLIKLKKISIRDKMSLSAEEESLSGETTEDLKT